MNIKIQNLWTIVNSCKQLCNYLNKFCWKQRLKAIAEIDISISIFWLCLLDPSKTYSVALVLPSIGFLEPLHICATLCCSLGRSSLFEISYKLYELSLCLQRPCLGNSRRHGWSCQWCCYKRHLLRLTLRHKYRKAYLNATWQKNI